MITRYGFSERLGPVVYGTSQEETFLGRDLGQGKGYSETTAAEIDSEMRDIIDEAYETDVYKRQVVNYTDAETPYTRIIEHKHFEFGTQPKTVISRESVSYTHLDVYKRQAQHRTPAARAGIAAASAVCVHLYLFHGVLLIE